MNQERSQQIRARCRENGDCLYWDSNAKTERAKRHPLMRVDNQVKSVRRELYEAERGALRAGYCLEPGCGDARCIEPQHQTQITTRQKNAKGGRLSSTSPTRGAKVAAGRIANGQTKLTREHAAEIRASEETGLALAKKYGVDPGTISLIRLGKTWKDYSSPFVGLGGSA